MLSNSLTYKGFSGELDGAKNGELREQKTRIKERNLTFYYNFRCITFLENPFSFSVALKTSLEPLRTIFP